MQLSRQFAERDGVRLSCLDSADSTAPTVMLLHGLAGYGEEWSETARRLATRYRVLAPDQRGHGISERAPKDMSRQAFIDDAVMWLERLGISRATVIGQSLGGHTAFLLAAQRPDVVAGLVVAEASPEADPCAPAAVSTWLSEWPVPFRTRDDAVHFFGDNSWGRAWAGGLERQADGYWPAFDPAVMLAALREGTERSYWAEWDSIACPTLVVRGERGMALAVARQMVKRLADAELVTIAAAGHDVHLDAPQPWINALDAFLPRAVSEPH